MDLYYFILLLVGIVAAVFAVVSIVSGPSIIARLIFKYLLKRRIAWVSLAAVMLCTTMVLVVISVMGGWLTMFKQSFHGLSGDVLVRSDSLAGFAYYEDMMQRIARVPGVEACVPTISSDEGFKRDIATLYDESQRADLVEYKSILSRSKADVTKWPGMIPGAGVVGIHRNDKGEWVGRDSGLYRLPVKLTVLGING